VIKKKKLNLVKIEKKYGPGVIFLTFILKEKKKYFLNFIET